MSERLLANPLLDDEAQFADKPAASSTRKYRIGLGVLGVTALIFFGLFIWKASEKHDNSPAALSDVLPEKTQSYIKSSMDSTADPCNNWYQFNCGGFQAAHPPPVNGTDYASLSFGQAENKTNDELLAVLNDKFQPVGEFFQGCLDPSQESDSDSLQHLVYWLKFVDSIEELNVDDFWYKLGVLTAHELTNLPFNVVPTPLYSNPDYNFPDPDMNMKLELQIMNVMAFEPNTVDLVSGMRANPTNFTRVMIGLQQLLKTDFGYDLFDSVHYSAATVTDAIFNNTAVFVGTPFPQSPFLAQAAKLSNLNMGEFLRGFGNHSYAFILAGKTDDDQPTHDGFADHIERLAVKDSAYFNRTTAFIRQQFITCSALKKVDPKAVCPGVDGLKATLKLSIIEAMSAVVALPEEMRSATKPAEHAAYCRAVLENNFDNVFLHEWFVDSFAPGFKDAVTDLVEFVYTELGRTISTNKWLDQETRTKALNKWSLMTRNIIYDASWENDQFGLVMTGKIGLDLVASNSYATQRLLLGLDVPGDIHSPERGFSGMTPATANAFYQPTDNSINLIPGLLQFPLFDPSLPMALNLASYAWVIGHEMTHGFDNSGRLFDSVGAFSNWWTPASIANFNTKSQCFVDQYSATSLYGHHIHGNDTLGENIADNGGIGLAWRSYQAHAQSTVTLMPGYTNDQLFWIWAGQTWCASMNEETVVYKLTHDVHSPMPIRGWAPFQNMPEFAQTWKCSADSVMGQSLTDKRCHLW